MRGCKIWGDERKGSKWWVSGRLMNPIVMLAPRTTNDQAPTTQTGVARVSGRHHVQNAITTNLSIDLFA